MADDIVTRLRAAARTGDLPLGVSFDCDAVADEIERLREQEQDLRMHAEQDACEIERLRAAGDALANVVKWAKWVSVGDDEHNALKAWQEARRG